ncbi:MAG: efflux RND transporter permease subunit [Marinifilaceae bacterium]|jgi:multidrug efflux pump subunit AcrB
MSLAEYSVKNRVVVSFALIFILLGGIASYFKMSKLEDAEFTIKKALVITQYPGASPHEVEQEVTDVIEKAVQATRGLDYVHSESYAGLSILNVEIKQSLKNREMPQIWDILRRKVNDIQGQLPAGAKPSVVMDDFGDVYGVFYALTGDGFSYAELKDYAEYIKRELLMVDNVGKIALFGTKMESVNIEISQSKVAELGINPGMIVQTLNAQGNLVNAGAINMGSQRVRIEGDGSFQSLEEIGEVVIQGPLGEQFLLKDIATITRDYIEPDRTMMRHNGHPALGISLSTAPGGNVVDMGEDVQKRVQELMAQLPVGIELNRVYDQAEEVVKANDMFIVNLLESVAIVVGILLLAMGLRSGLLIGSGLIFSILGTLMVMKGFDIALQRTSLAAIIIAMGMLVDNAIVVTDGALVALQKGVPRRKAIVGAATSTAWPLLGATLIAILAFLPIYLAPTNAGEICASLFMVLAISLGLSWILAMVQTPMSCDLFLKVNTSNEKSDPYGGKAYLIFRSFLEKCLKHRVASVLVLLILLVGAGFSFTKVKKAFFLELDKPQFMVDYWLPEGSHINQVSEDLKELEQYLMAMPEVVNVTTSIGQTPPRNVLMAEAISNNPSFGQLFIETHSYDEVNAIKGNVERYIKENYPDVEPRVKTYIGGPNIKFKVEARFSGPDPAVLHELADQAKAIMRADEATKDVRDNWRQRVMVWDPQYSQARARRSMVSRSDVANSLRRATEGLPVGLFRDNEEKIPIMLRTTSDDQRDISNLTNTPVWGMGQASVPLKQVVKEIQVKWEDPVIRRYNRRRAITAQCDPADPTMTGNTLFARLHDKIEAIPLPEGYTLEWEGEYRPQQESNEGIATYFPLAIVLILFIIVALFNSVRQPLIITLIVPLSLIGVSLGLLITGKAFGFMAIVGFLGLMGMVIKNAVVLIDQIDLNLADGMSPYQAVVQSAISRMRPVMMASLTTILGMIPLVTDAMYGAMAVTIMFGLLFATVLTLIVVPLLYVIFYRIPSELSN